jgi:hydroxypyruvate reductase
VILGTNLHALNAAREEAERLGYHTVILTSHIAGEAREVARVLAAMAKDAGVFGCAHEKPVCLLSGGETTVTLRGRGRGGRNQEMALAFLWEMEKDPKSLSRAQFLAFSTDGEDGPTDAAGGFASMPMVEKARSERLKISEYLRDNDSYSLLKKLDGLFVTGPTNTNVCDIQILLVPR